MNGREKRVVNSLCEWGDNYPRMSPQVLASILGASVHAAHKHGLLYSVAGRLCPEVIANLAQPFKVCFVFHLKTQNENRTTFRRDATIHSRDASRRFKAS